MDTKILLHIITFYLKKTTFLINYFLHFLHALFRYVFHKSKLNKTAPIIIPIIDKTLFFYFRLCNLSPCTIDLDDQTTLHFWVPNKRKNDKGNLVILHGYGGFAHWQFTPQVKSLTDNYNLYVPDLLFFGKSFTKNNIRSDKFQAECIVNGLNKLGLDGFSVCGVSYGGFVARRMAEIYPQNVDRVMIVSGGIVYSEHQKRKYLENIGRNIFEILVPEFPKDLKTLVTYAVYNKEFFGNWVPDFLAQEFINVMNGPNRKGQRELIEYLLNRDPNDETPIIHQETLLIWGDQDRVFPVELGHQLHRTLGPKSRLVILENVGHVANVEAPKELNNLINSFILGTSNK